MEQLKATDSIIYEAIQNEKQRQQHVIELIASENIVSPAILQALGSCLTNKYAEGYPNKRYYGGNEFIDVCEQTAIDRAKKLFGAEHANVQPHAGSQANMEAFFSILKLKDSILAMSLEHGGHLTHGHPVNFSGSFYNVSHYGVNKETEQIDMDEVRKLAEKNKPKLLLAGASAYPRSIDFKEFADIANDVGAYFMVDMAHIAGLVATGLHNDPIPYADIVTTTTHKTLRGPRGAMILSKQIDKYDKDGKWNLAQKIDRAVFPGMQGGPLEHVIAAKAVAFKEAAQPAFKNYQRQIILNAKAMGDRLMDHGFRLVSGGTDNHLILIDLISKGVMGKEAEAALDKANICSNKNMIPFDPSTPFKPSGIRIGTPAITSRGFTEDDSRQVADWINKVITNINDERKIASVKEEVIALCKQHVING